jgi:hypothetical protein
MSELQERPPSIQKMSTAGPLGGTIEDSGALTIHVRNVDGGPPGPRGGSGLQSGSERCVVNLSMINKK